MSTKKISAKKPDNFVETLPDSYDVFSQAARKFSAELVGNAKKRTAFYVQAGILGRDGKVVPELQSGRAFTHLY
jgi:hypothetical protein